MFELQTYRNLLVKAENGITAAEKGKSFEEVCFYLFSNLPGIQILKRNAVAPSEEVDIILFNDQTGCFRAFDPIILVECKNWAKPVGAPALDSFIGKLRRRSLNTGILVASMDITGRLSNGGEEKGAAGIIRSALAEGIRIIVLPAKELHPIQSPVCFYDLIWRRLCALYEGPCGC